MCAEGEVDRGTVLGGGRMRELSLHLSSHGPLLLQLPTQPLILSAEGV